jgi:xanthine dehydrogenase large subunit
MSAVGKPLPHESARGHVTGAALYTDDLLPRFAGLLHAWPVHAPHAHARLTRLATEGALEVPGVVTVLTAEDVPGENDSGCARRDEPIFATQVLYHGQAVAWVLGETEEAARLGAARVRAEYEPLPAILTIQDAITKDSFLTEQFVIRRGEPEGAIARAPQRLSGEVEVGGQEHFYLETQAALAHMDEAGHLFVHSSTQHPTETQDIVARALGVANHAVTVQSLRMGGAFGGKEVQANAWAAVAAIGCKKTGRPVRVRLTRQQDMVLTGKRHSFLGRFEVGFDDQGKLLGASIDLFSDGGWCLDLSKPVLYRGMFHVDNCYLVPALEVRGRVCQTHKASNTAFRGFGGPQGMVVIEEIVDRVARALGLPPDVVRERNFYREGDRTHYGQLVTQAERIAAVWTDLKRWSDFEARGLAVEAFNASHADTKRGLAITPVKFGISFTTAFYNQAGALVLVYRDGSVQLNHGGTEMGQGLHTKMLQVAADALGVPMESVRSMPTRTDKVPNTSATAASSGSDLNGAAVLDACQTLRARLADVAAQTFNVNRNVAATKPPSRGPEHTSEARRAVDPEDVRFADGKVFPHGAPERAVAFAEVTERAYLERVPLSATGYYRTPNIHFDEALGQGKPFHYFAYGAAVSEVEVDGFTGQYRLLRVDILHDAGDSLSPLVDRGQVEGGFIQGVGWLTLEELKWDALGRFATRGASTYKLPSLGECPDAFNVRLLERATEPGVVHGSKAVGEPPLMLAISVREALRAAASAFGAGGALELGCPATPEAVFFAIERARAAKRAARVSGEAAE